MTVSRDYVISSFCQINAHLVKYVGLHPNWILAFDRNKSAAGRCFYNKRKISISMDYLNSIHVTEHDVYDTLLHEFAHAIAGAASGHGPIWVHVAKILGCSANVYCKRFIHETDYKYVVVCPIGCKKYRHRMCVDAHRVCPVHQEDQIIYDTKTKRLII